MKSAQSRGFTLIEVATVVFIFSLIVIALYTVYTNYDKILAQQEIYIDTAGSIGASFNDIRSSVLQADHVVSSHTFSGTTLTSTTTSLVLELPSIDSSGNIVAASYDYVGYYMTGTKLERLSDINAASARTSSSRALSATLNTLSFTYDNVDPASVTNVTVDATTSETYRTKSTTAHLRETMYLRNKL